MANDVIKRVKIALGLLEGTVDSKPEDKQEEKKVEMAVEAMLLDGTKIGTDTAFEPGASVYVIAEDGSTSPAPEGVHETEDMKITVDANGIISAVEPKESEDSKAEIEIELADEGTGNPTETPEAPAEEDFKKTLMEAVETLAAKCKALEEKYAALEEKIGSTEQKMKKISSEPGAERIKNTPSKVSLRSIGKEDTELFDKKLEILKEIRKSQLK